jgi:hypothetical protein
MAACDGVTAAHSGSRFPRSHATFRRQAAGTRALIAITDRSRRCAIAEDADVVESKIGNEAQSAHSS